MLKTTKTLLLCIVLLVPALCAQKLAAGEEDSSQHELLLDPNAVSIGLFFHQGRVSVQGTLPAGCDPALVVLGQDQEVNMSTLGKRLGLWMAVGAAEFEKAPSFYQCVTSKPLADIAPAQTLRENGLGFEAIENKLIINLEVEEGAKEEGNTNWKKQFVKYKKESGLYLLNEGALQVTPEEGGRETVRGEIVIPARAPEGRYQVMLIGFKDGTVVARVEDSLSVRLIGAVAFLRDLAMKHGWTYGIVAVIVALAAGLGVGVIVPSKGSH